MSTQQPHHVPRLSRDEKALHMHDRWTQLAIDANRLLSERTNIFLLASSILFAGFVFSFDKIMALGIALPVIGIGLCFLHYLNAASASHSIAFCWLCLLKLEGEESALNSFKQRDLAPHSAHWKYWFEDQQRKFPSPPRPQGGIFKRECFGKFNPATISVTCIPITFAILWIVGLIAVGFCWK